MFAAAVSPFTLLVNVTNSFATLRAATAARRPGRVSRSNGPTPPRSNLSAAARPGDGRGSGGGGGGRCSWRQSLLQQREGCGGVGTCRRASRIRSGASEEIGGEISHRGMQNPATSPAMSANAGLQPDIAGSSGTLSCVPRAHDPAGRGTPRPAGRGTAGPRERAAHARQPAAHPRHSIVPPVLPSTQCVAVDRWDLCPLAALLRGRPAAVVADAQLRRVPVPGAE